MIASKWSPATVEQLISESELVVSGTVVDVVQAPNPLSQSGAGCDESSSVGAYVEVQVAEQWLGSELPGTELSVWWAPDNLPFDVGTLNETLVGDQVIVFLQEGEIDQDPTFFVVSDYGIVSEESGTPVTKLAGDPGDFFQGSSSFKEVKLLVSSYSKSEQ